jgi:hypothetical protein
LGSKKEVVSSRFFPNWYEILELWELFEIFQVFVDEFEVALVKNGEKDSESFSESGQNFRFFRFFVIFYQHTGGGHI